MDRQKMLTIFGIAWVSAALLTWFLYAKTKAPKQEKTIKIVAAARDLQPGARVGKSDVKLITLLEKDAPRVVMSSEAEALGRAVLYPVSANEPMNPARLTAAQGAEGAAAMLENGKRAMSVSFNDASGASGLIQPRSKVDVLFTRTGNALEAMTVTLLEDVEVLSIGRNTVIDNPSANAASGGSTSSVPRTVTQTGSTARTATLIVTPEEAQKLELAKNQGRISLALRNPLDKSRRAESKPSTMEEIEPLLVARSPGANLKGRRLPANLRDKNAWSGLIGDEEAKPKPPPPPPKPEPPKPRVVVDVFRGEKHVQEIFQ
jgi:pilus assembly protein CpaB